MDTPLIAALVFATVVVGVLALFRREPARVAVGDRLEAIRAEGGSTREAALAMPFSQRVLLPSLGTVWTFVRGFIPAASLPLVRANLAKAGRRYEDPAAWIARKWLRMLVFAAAGVVIGAMQRLSGEQVAGLGLGCALLGYVSVELSLRSAIRRRQELIVRAIPDTLDLLTITVEAGLGLDQSLEVVTRQTRGPLADEIKMYLSDVSLGADRMSALRAMGTRTGVADLMTFTSTVAQAMEFGVSIAGVLRAQSEDARARHRARVEERAQKAPVKLLFPLIFLILPAMFVVVAGPAFIQFGKQFGSIGAPAAPGR